MIHPEIIELRKELHSHPELSCFEHETAKRIQRFINEHNPTEILDGIGETGFAAIYKFPKKGKSITIRCELDALPIQEENQFLHKSKYKGISHKCGHDGHMAIVSGLLFWLKKSSFSSGEVILLFQPAEENGKGAKEVVTDERFKNLNTDYVFALHNIPKEPLHNIIVINKGFSAEVQSFNVRLKGKKSHASEPENGNNPALALSNIISLLSSLEVTDPEDENFSLITPVHINMGQIAYGISPENAELHYTMRTWSGEKTTHLKSQITSVIENTCEKYELKHEIEWLEYFPASTNHTESTNYIIKAAKKNSYKITKRSYPFKFGEDFGWFSKEYKTAMFGLGAGIETPALHNSDYDFPDEIIETGINMFRSIISTILEES
ncbi:amidohydrolase [Zobellia sp. B3R18]|uniref:amidohydrolase n=1 Tax=Zobellia sp. B3R18 TaxID=2841568 RepID=UPI001C076278|nr:amidohydrolase [Zobellia sp. B3R18]MBU2976496.1 amidohydrolase [Zobellia sp. B3R18]